VAPELRAVVDHVHAESHGHHGEVETRDDAQRAGIQLPSERQMAMGVGGPIEVIPVTLDRVAVGGIEARSVEAAIADETPVSLLGQSYLQRVGSVEIRGDTMVLR